MDFHGQTLMLVHWSILAYTSVLKILKKHYKRTGLQVQQFNTQLLLSQPFCSVEVPFCLLQACHYLSTQVTAFTPVAVTEIVNLNRQANSAVDQRAGEES